jgi:hypothetical protein
MAQLALGVRELDPLSDVQSVVRIFSKYPIFKIRSLEKVLKAGNKIDGLQEIFGWIGEGIFCFRRSGDRGKCHLVICPGKWCRSMTYLEMCLFSPPTFFKTPTAAQVDARCKVEKHTLSSINGGLASESVL